MEKRGKLRYETLCDRRCSGATLDDFAILNGFAIQRLVAGLVWFQHRAIEVEAGERSLGVTYIRPEDCGNRMKLSGQRTRPNVGKQPSSRRAVDVLGAPLALLGRDLGPGDLSAGPEIEGTRAREGLDLWIQAAPEGSGSNSSAGHG